MAMVKTKRWDDPIESDDGIRILVTRYRPRALRKENETWDLWERNLGPSADLHAAYYGKNGAPISWPSYCATFHREMRNQKTIILDLARQVATGKTITLLCSSACTRENRCHRSLLRNLILAEISRFEGSLRVESPLPVSA